MLPQHRDEGMEQPRDERGRKDCEGEEAEQVFSLRETRKLRRTAAHEQGTQKRFKHVQGRIHQVHLPGSMNHRGADCMAQQGRTKISGPETARGQKQVSEDDTIGNPDQVTLGHGACQARCKGHAEHATREPEREGLWSQPSDQ